jgi:histidyl-tRNA synthetase
MAITHSSYNDDDDDDDDDDREHYQWNMDIIGVEGVEAEAELLSAVVTSLKQMGLTSKDVGIKVCCCEILVIRNRISFLLLRNRAIHAYMQYINTCYMFVD